MDGKDFIDASKKAETKPLEKVLLEERQQLVNASTNSLEKIAEYWQQNKAVLDAIAEQASRLTEAYQAVSTDFSNIQVPDTVMKDLMLNLKDTGVLDYIDDDHPAVVTTHQLRRYIDGANIVIKDLNRLNKLAEQMEEVSNAASAVIDAYKQPEVVMPRLHHPEVAAVQRQQADHELQRQLQRQKLKNDRILAERDIPSERHTLRIISDWLEDFGSADGTSVSVDFYYFNFEPTVYGRKRFEKLLDRLIAEGYFKEYRKNPYAGGISFSFIGINRDRLNRVVEDVIVMPQTRTSNTSSAPLPPRSLVAAFSVVKEWEKLRIEVVQDGERIECFYTEKTLGMFHYDDIGFGKDSSSSAKPVKSWDMLLTVAMNDGNFPYTQEHHSTKKDLQARLKSLFPNAIGKPIECDKTKKLYEFQMQLIDKRERRDSYEDRNTYDVEREFLKPIS